MKMTKKCELSVIEIGLIRREKTGLALRNVQIRLRQGFRLRCATPDRSARQEYSKTFKNRLQTFKNGQKLYGNIQ
jgi:hypothetical protein